MTISEYRVDGDQKSEAYNYAMSILHETSTLEQLDLTLNDLSDSVMAAVLSRPRTDIVFPAGCGADALQAALELAATIR